MKITDSSRDVKMLWSGCSAWQHLVSGCLMPSWAVAADVAGDGPQAKWVALATIS